MPLLLVKVGSNVLTKDNGYLNIDTLHSLSSQIAELKYSGWEVLLISSGSVAAGRKIVPQVEGDAVARRQVWASVGQIELMKQYRSIFRQLDVTCAQVLVTSGDFRDRAHYLNIRACIQNMLKNNILPIVNENDVVSVSELMFTDNDELASLLATQLNASLVSILTNVDGVLSHPPDHPDSKPIRLIDPDFPRIQSVIKVRGSSSFGRGGMLTKCKNARKLANTGIEVVIANGTQPNILLDIIKGNSVGTRFTPRQQATSPRRWLAHGQVFFTATVTINAGAALVMRNLDKAASLLPVGVMAYSGAFKKGDVISIQGPEGKIIGHGRAQYSSEKLEKVMGQKGQKPLIHYDYLYLEKKDSPII